MGQEKPEQSNPIDKLLDLYMKLWNAPQCRWKVSENAYWRLLMWYSVDIPPHVTIWTRLIDTLYGLPVEIDPTVPDGYVILCAADGSEGTAYIEPYSFAEAYIR